MNESDLWQQIYSAFEFHRKTDEPDAQSALNRIVRRCLRCRIPPSITPSAFEVSRVNLVPERVCQLKLAHGEASPRVSEGEIIVLSCMRGMFVVDGNNRVNRWRLSGFRGSIPAILIKSRSLLQ